ADSDDSVLIALVLGYGCAIGAAVILFQIAKKLAPVESEEDYYRGIEYADRLRVGEHFRAQAASPPPATDAYTDSPENLPQSADRRVQEKPHTESRGSSGS